MRTLNLALAERSYQIHVGTGLLAEGGLVAPLLKQKKVLVVSNTTVAPLYLSPLTAAFEAKGVQVETVILPDGEQYKNWKH